MKTDLPGVIRRVAAFLGVSPLSDAELAEVSRKCGFEYMRDHAGSFEMHPPHLLASDAELFVKGSSDRYRDIDPAMRERIMGWSRQALAHGEFPIDVEYAE